ncbi:malonate--CoA ligase [Oceanimonas baumannii]|uniref:malonate--CoA ligase n=1 Tax=Oceanimonas baumannii TaxID=129578 RepID=UPI003A92F0F5
MNNNLYLQFQPHLQQQKTFIDTPEGKVYRYCDSMVLAQRLAGALSAAGIKKGDRVAVQTDKSPEAIMLYLACLQLGAVYLPLNTAYTDAEISYFLQDSEPTLYICRPEVFDEALAIARQCGVPQVESLGTDADGSLMQLVNRTEPMQEIADVDADDLAAILYTSGTTGRSKGAMLTHSNLGSNCRALAECWHYSAEDHLLHALPIFHTHGLFVACNITLTVGASMTFLAKLDPEQLLDLMPRATVLMGVPTFYTRLLQSPRLNQTTVANMRLFVSGSAPLLAETHDEFRARTGHAILERYGMTETNMNTSNPYQGDRKAGTVGLPLPGTELRITNRENGAILPHGETGMVELRGPNIFKGYWRMPEKTKEEFRTDGFFITGDLGKLDEHGYLQIVGRDKDLVISGGYNVYPKEIEQLIDELPDICESAVIGVPHPDLGEGVTAVVVPKPGATPDETEIRRHLNEQLARYKQPKCILLVESLPRNVMGKVQKNQLRAQYKDLYLAEATTA